MLTVEDVCEVSGLEPQTLRNWVSGGLVVPAERATRGPGGGNKFSVTQAVGLVVAEQLRRAERGCAPSYVAKVVAAFGAVTEAWLRAEFEEGRTHLAMVHQPFDPPGKLWLQQEQCPEWGWPDVAAALAAVKSSNGRS